MFGDTHSIVNRRDVVRGAAALGAFGTTLLHDSRPAKATPETFAMGFDASGPTCHIGQYAALAKDFFAEEGLRVRGIAALDNRTAVDQGRAHRLWVKIDTGTTEADFGYFDTDQLHHMVAGKVDYYIVDGNHFGCWSLMVAPNGPIQSVADLKGKTIEIVPYAVEPFLLHGHMWLHHWLKAPGLDAPRDVTLKTYSWEAHSNLNDYVADGFKTGRIAAVVVGEPRPLLMEDKGIARRLITQDATTHDKEFCCLTVIKRAIVDNDPGTAAKIARAIKRARIWAGQHPREAVLAAQAAGYYGAKVPVEASAMAIKCCLSFDSQLDVAQALERALATRIESGGIKTDKTPQELVRLYYRSLEHT
jgi:ABC-type nitrate/sulfonate/bicarbonate transport system substrate-binding protein